MAQSAVEKSPGDEVRKDRGPCSIEGCSKPAQARGWCSTHYSRWQRFGDPNAEVRQYASNYNGATCGVDGCEKAVHAHGWCPTHLRRWTLYGDPLGTAPPGRRRGRTPKVKGACSVDGCDRAENARGWCTMHYNRVLKTGEPGPAERTVRQPSPNRRTCSLDGCDRPLNARGWCKLHLYRVDTYGEPGPVDPVDKHLPKPSRLCSVEGCDRVVRGGGNGYCKLHYERVRRLGDPGPAQVLNAPKGSGHVTKQGYRRLAEGRQMEHRLVMEKHIGRPLWPDENVHHRNGDRSDNRIENLELWSTSQPSGQHVTDKIKWAQEILARYADLPPDV